MVDPRPSLGARTIVWVFVCLVALAAFAVAGSTVVMPRCASCHMKGDFAKATKASAHASIECARCHAPGALGKVTYGSSQLLHAVAPKSTAGRASSWVADSACRSCHADIDSGAVNANGVTIRHSTCAVGSSCSDCHSTTAHGKAVRWQRAYTMDKCLKCHVEKAEMAACDKCHDGRRTTERITSGPWRVTHGPNWRQTHGMGDTYTCAACHREGFCGKCHGPGLPHTVEFKTDHPARASEPGAKCKTCHDAKFCSDCHGLPMPHPSGFKKQHSATVDKNGDKTCKTCHSQKDCTTCHEKHIHPGGAIRNPQIVVPTGGDAR